MPIDGLQRIIVVPRNGYANRLQAWASASAMGRQLEVPVEMLWAPQPVAPASAQLLFDADVVQKISVTVEEVTQTLIKDELDAPSYLNRVLESDTLILSGDDRGEQVFMEQLVQELATPPLPRVLVIIAGGHFHLPGTADPQGQRRAFYRELAWSGPVLEAVNTALAKHPEPYIGLHLRGTDRSVTAPRSAAVRKAMHTLSDRTGISSVFIAADTADARNAWKDAESSRATRPWWVEHSNFDRSLDQAAVSAVVDWILLGQASGLVYPSASSFGHEAAVAMGNRGPAIGLVAPKLTQHGRELRTLATHGWRRVRRSGGPLA
ncbi:MAG: hypothetical protein Q8M73_02515 [Actinomycetota bacterium]|nr:hypothetical protein [Actinomycetota bacterium]